MRPSSRLRNAATVGAYLAPSLVGLAVFFLVPLADVARRSFTNTAGTQSMGLANYEAVLESEAFALAAGNTARFLAVGVPLLLVLSLCLALLVRRTSPLRWLAKSALLLPLALPAFTVALVQGLTFDAGGMADGLLDALGLPPVAWLDGAAAPLVLVGNYLWRNLGFCMVLWLAALACIPEHLYEAARMDGARAWRITGRITLPLLLPSGAVVAILAVANAFKVYREMYLLAGAYPPEGLFLLPHLFNNWFASLAVGKLAAAGILLGLALLAVALVLFGAQRLVERSRR